MLPGGSPEESYNLGTYLAHRMVLSGTYRAQLDRVREDVAIIALFQDGETVEEIAVDRGSIPGSEIRHGEEFRVTLAGGAIRSISRETQSE